MSALAERSRSPDIDLSTSFRLLGVQIGTQFGNTPRIEKHIKLIDVAILNAAVIINPVHQAFFIVGFATGYVASKGLPKSEQNPSDYQLGRESLLASLIWSRLHPPQPSTVTSYTS